MLICQAPLTNTLLLSLLQEHVAIVNAHAMYNKSYATIIEKCYFLWPGWELINTILLIMLLLVCWIYIICCFFTSDFVGLIFACIIIFAAQAWQESTLMELMN